MFQTLAYSHVYKTFVFQTDSMEINMLQIWTDIKHEANDWIGKVMAANNFQFHQTMQTVFCTNLLQRSVAENAQLKGLEILKFRYWIEIKFYEIRRIVVQEQASQMLTFEYHIYICFGIIFAKIAKYFRVSFPALSFLLIYSHEGL
jgi:hypothetical protein